MSSEEVKARIFNAFMEAFSHGNISELDAICAPNMIDHSLEAASGQPNDVEGFKRRVAGHRIGMPDLQASITNMILDGDLLAFQWELSGTNTGPYMGRPPSGKPIRFVGMNLEHLENGLIVEHWSYPDRVSLMRQLGVLPA